MSVNDDFFRKLSKEAVEAGLSFLIVGGHAVNAYGYQRTTLDADLLISEDSLAEWRSFWEDRDYQCVHATNAFCQFRFKNAAECFPVDLMIVDRATFEKLQEYGKQREVGGAIFDVPDPLHLIALKLHALRNEARAKSSKDLSDIFGLVRVCGIDVQSSEFLDLLSRYADEKTKTEIKRHFQE